jgi:hypothetical protein
MTSEFKHYGSGHSKHRADLDNCSACALMFAEHAPNYAGWPLAFLDNGRTIPERYLPALKEELARTDNEAYVNNLKQKLKGTSYESLSEQI